MRHFRKKKRTLKKSFKGGTNVLFQPAERYIGETDKLRKKVIDAGNADLAPYSSNDSNNNIDVISDGNKDILPETKSGVYDEFSKGSLNVQEEISDLKNKINNMESKQERVSYKFDKNINKINTDLSNYEKKKYKET